MQLIDGKKIASEIKSEIALEVTEIWLRDTRHRTWLQFLLVTMAAVKPMWQERSRPARK